LKIITDLYGYAAKRLHNEAMQQRPDKLWSIFGKVRWPYFCLSLHQKWRRIGFRNCTAAWVVANATGS